MRKKELKQLSGKCFDIEASLPLFNYSNTQKDTDAQALRKELYRIRCAIKQLEGIYGDIEE